MSSNLGRVRFAIETPAEVGERLKRARGDRTQGEFARMIGVSRTALANYEAGRRLPNDAILGKIAEHAGTTIPELLFGPTVTPFGEYIRRIEEGAERAAATRPGFIPRFTISDDELAFISLFRLYAEEREGWAVVRKVVEYWTDAIAHAKSLPDEPPIAWGEAHLETLKRALEKGNLERGYDPHELLWATLWEESEARKRDLDRKVRNEGPQTLSTEPDGKT